MHGTNYVHLEVLIYMLLPNTPCHILITPLRWTSFFPAPGAFGEGCYVQMHPSLRKYLIKFNCTPLAANEVIIPVGFWQSRWDHKSRIKSRLLCWCIISKWLRAEHERLCNNPIYPSISALPADVKTTRCPTIIIKWPLIYIFWHLLRLTLPTGPQCSASFKA